VPRSFKWSLLPFRLSNQYFANRALDVPVYYRYNYEIN
jgi:hypothetical protein